ncbi:MAG: S-layer homology domain-containing protein [bacterium]
MNSIARSSVIGALLTFAIVFVASSHAFPNVYMNYVDPTDVGVCPRSLGMGRAYVAAADDVNSIFMNPAGLSFAKNLGATYGFTSVRYGISNSFFGAYFSKGDETFGLGLVSSATSNPLTAAPSRQYVTGRLITIDATADTFTSSVALLSYGVKLGKYIDLPIINDTSFGISFKGFSRQAATTEEVFPASGLDIDMGLIYKANAWLRFGLFGQNVLGQATGGKIVWSDGYEESIPASIKAGISTKVLGNEGMVGFGQDLYLNLDAEQSYYVTNSPTLYHGGLEWWPVEYAALRLGVDQLLILSSGKYIAENNYTGGIGLKYGDLGIDYTYHKYGEIIDDMMHYLSVSYAFSGAGKEEQAATEKAEEPVTKEAAAEECLALNSPADKSIIYTNSVLVSFEVINNKVAQLEINGNKFAATGEASPKAGEAGKLINVKISVPSAGKFAVKIKCADEAGIILKEDKIRLLMLPVFKDVSEGFWAHDKIAVLSALKLFNGYPDGTFKPNKTITRAELISILVKSAEDPTIEAVGATFKDVKSNNWAAPYIKKGVALGFASGYSDGTFKPSKAVTRAEGVSIIVRAAHLKVSEEAGASLFDDVPADHWVANTLAAAKAGGLLDFIKSKTFNPNKSMTRADAVAILSQTSSVKEKAAELLDWETGFE